MSSEHTRHLAVFGKKLKRTNNLGSIHYTLTSTWKITKSGFDSGASLFISSFVRFCYKHSGQIDQLATGMCTGGFNEL